MVSVLAREKSYTRFPAQKPVSNKFLEYLTLTSALILPCLDDFTSCRIV